MSALVVRRKLARAAGLASLAALVSGCMPAGGSQGSADLASLWSVFIVGGAVVFGIVATLTTWSVLRYRRHGGPLPRQTSGNTPLEAIWTIVPFITVLALFWFSFNAFWVAQPSPAKPGDLAVDVTAFRWGWQFTYPDSGTVITSADGSTPELVVPVDTTIHVTLTSRDVNHAFYVPNFLYKRDAIPGRPTDFDLRVVQTGTYGGECAEYCGVLHDAMPFTIRAVTTQEFAAWLAAGGPTPNPGGSPPYPTGSTLPTISSVPSTAP